MAFLAWRRHLGGSRLEFTPVRCVRTFADGGVIPLWTLLQERSDHDLRASLNVITLV